MADQPGGGSAPRTISASEFKATCLRLTACPVVVPTGPRANRTRVQPNHRRRLREARLAVSAFSFREVAMLHAEERMRLNRDVRSWRAHLRRD